MSVSMEGRVAYISGGSCMMARGTATAFLEAGGKVVLGDMKQELLDAAKADLVSKGFAAENIATAIVNVTDWDSIRSSFDQAEAAFGTVDVLVNNAGISLIRQIQDTTPEDYDALMGVNCKGVFLCSRAAAVDMLRRHSGAIVNVSSMWGQVGASCETVYSMSKAGVIGFTRALAQELAPEGIAVNCVAPGIIDTRMNACFDRAELEAEVPMGRLGTPREVAEAVLYLAESPYVTGQVLGVNGGIV